MATRTRDDDGQDDGDDRRPRRRGSPGRVTIIEGDDVRDWLDRFFGDDDDDDDRRPPRRRRGYFGG